MKTVLFCTQTAVPVGGVATWLDNISPRLPALGWRPIVGLAQGSRFHRPEVYRAAHPGLETVLLDGRLGSHAGRVGAIEEAARRVGANVVIPLSIVDAYDAVARMKRGGSTVRLVAAVHGVAPRMLLDVRSYLRFCDAAVGVTRLISRLLVEGVGVAPARVHYVPYAVDEAFVARVADREHRTLSLGYVGRLDLDKRIGDLGLLCERLVSAGVDFRLSIVGTGREEQALRDLLSPLVARGVVTFLGARRRSELYQEVYPSLDVLLLFSGVEGFPLVLIEAMKHGVVPVTARFLGAASEGLLRHDGTALFFDAGALDQAVELIRGLALDRAAWQRLSLAASHAAAEYSSIDGCVRGWAAAFDAACSAEPACDPAFRFERPSSGRLDALLSPAFGDSIRRLVGRHFIHHDTHEWPFATPGNLEAEERLMRIAAQLDYAGVAPAVEAMAKPD